MSTKPRVTMMDIASKAGVSQPTVSFVLNGQLTNRISQQTRDKVLAVAQELGYIKRTKPAEQAKNSSKTAANIYTTAARPYKIALVLDGNLITNDHFICGLQAATEAAHVKGVNLSIISAAIYSAPKDHESAVHMQHVMEELNGNYYDGIIIASSGTRDLLETVHFNKPVVYLNCLPLHDKQALAILPDDFGGAYNLAEKLVNTYKRPHIIAGDEWMQATMERTRAIVSCYNKYSIRINQQNITYTNWSFQESFRAVLRLLADFDGGSDAEHFNAVALVNLRVKPQDQRPDILYCASDFLATAAYQAVYFAGLRIPEDIAVTGFDNQILSTDLQPQLSTVVLPYSEMGKTAIEKICEQIEVFQGKKRSADDEGHIIKIPSRVILRAST